VFLLRSIWTVAKLRSDSLDDLNGITARLRITCRECDHSAVYLTRDIVSYFRAKNWSRLFAHAEVRFRCDGCGARNASFRAWREPAAPPAPPKPEPLPHPDDQPRGSGRRR
jgi:ribosomal protein S27E